MALPNRLFATRADFVLKAGELGPGQVLTITQLDGLTLKDALTALVAQYGLGQFDLRHHENVFFIHRSNVQPR